MVIGRFDGTSKPRSAQGPKSRAFHFSAPVCAECNSSRTQASDREFDRFHLLVSEAIARGDSPESVFSFSEYDLDSEKYLNVFRYFAKILCCHVAESGGPRPFVVSEFSIGESNWNVISLHIDADPTYQLYQARLGEHKYAAHGGLIVPVNAETGLPSSFRSSITLGPVRYIFSVGFDARVGEALRIFHHDFWLKCEAAYREALANPLSDEQRKFLGV